MSELSSRRIIATAAAVAFLAACSSNSTMVPSQSGSATQVGSSARVIPGAAVEGRLLVPAPHPFNLPHVWPSRTKQQQVLFVADPQDNQVLMYDPKTPNPSPEGSLTSGITYPFGDAVDKQGNLYVANLLGGTSDLGSVVVFNQGSTSPSLTITSGIDGPYGVAVDSKGNVFVTNLDNDTIVGYAKGSTTPFESIDFSSYGQALGIATDKHDNIWLGSDTTSQVYEIPAGSTTPQNAGLSGLNGTIGVAFGDKDVLFAGNFGGSNVTVYKSGQTAPFETITSGIETHGPTLNGVTHSDYLFQSNQNGNVSGYKKNKTSPFSTITGIPDPRGIASTPLVKK